MKCFIISIVVLLLIPSCFAESFRYDFDSYSELELYENTHIEFSSLVLNNISIHNNLIAHYPLDTDSNDTKNNYHGTDTNTYYQYNISKFGGAVRLYRNNQSIIDLSDYFNELDNISVSLWFNIKNAKKTQCIFSIGDNDHFLSLIIMSENVPNPEKPLRVKLIYVNGDYKQECYIHQKVSVGIWYHLALTINQDNGSTIYLNTNKAYCPDINVSPSDLPGSSKTLLGYVYNYDGEYIEYYDGWIDNLMIFNTTLNDSEIEHLYDVEYVNYVYSGFVITQFVNIPLLQQYTDFKKSDNVPTGTGAKYYYRITETDPFIEITHLTNWEWVPTDSKKIQFKIKLNSTGDYTPYINWIEIQYITYVVIPPDLSINHVNYSPGELYLNASISKGNNLLNDGIFTLYIDSQDQGTGFNIYDLYADITKVIGLDGQHTIKVNWTIEKITGGYYYLEDITTINISHIPPDLSINHVNYSPGELYLNASILRGNNTIGNGIFTLYIDSQDQGTGFNIYDLYADIEKVIGLDGQHTIKVNWTIEKITGGYYYLENSTIINVVSLEPYFIINTADYYNGYLNINLSLYRGNNTIGNGVFYLYVNGDYKGSSFNISQDYAEINITSPLETGIHEISITWDIPKISGGSYLITRNTIIEAINTIDIVKEKAIFEFLEFQKLQIDYFVLFLLLILILLILLIWNLCKLTHIHNFNIHMMHHKDKKKMPKEHKKPHHRYGHHKGEFLS